MSSTPAEALADALYNYDHDDYPELIDFSTTREAVPRKQDFLLDRRLTMEDALRRMVYFGPDGFPCNAKYEAED